MEDFGQESIGFKITGHYPLNTENKNPYSGINGQER